VSTGCSRCARKLDVHVLNFPSNPGTGCYRLILIPILQKRKLRLKERNCSFGVAQRSPDCDSVVPDAPLIPTTSRQVSPSPARASPDPPGPHQLVQPARPPGGANCQTLLSPPGPPAPEVPPSAPEAGWTACGRSSPPGSYHQE
jgi:hypothetical protein